MDMTTAIKPTLQAQPALRQACGFIALVLALALAAGLLLRAVPLPESAAFAICAATPTLATLLMILRTPSGERRAAWRSLGLHRLGLRTWWIAIVVTLATSVAATAAVLVTGMATFTRPADLTDTVMNFVISLAMLTVSYVIAEELGFRGYLLPRLLPLGRNRALVIVGIVHAAWHLPWILLTSMYHADGNLAIVLPLFVATLIAASFFYGDLRIATDSVWPATIAHGVHNVAWNAMGAFYLTATPVVVDEYLAGDNGVYILAATTLAAIWLRWWVNRRVVGRPAPARQAKDRAAADAS